MKRISELINEIKSKHRGVLQGVDLAVKNKDFILYGDPDKECTGIVTTCFASIDVIRQAHELGANFIIAHEALFWNHGDRRDWLKDNETFIAKKKLLDETGIVVWRNHDYIHSGINVDGKWTDGIFYGVMKEIGFDDFLIGDESMPQKYAVKPLPARDFAELIIERFGLNGLRYIGDLSGTTEKILFPIHIMGQYDDGVLSTIEEENIDTVITMEVTDYTVSEYIRDSAMAGRNKRILHVGHFNVEEPGMAYFAKFLPNMIGNDLPITFIKSGDGFKYL